ncbi:MAG: SDR family NAD(P)-dependent oxidoreductase [Bacilli bacterium]|nr:SDR family NAD(P)-dependent oxidoreductase [Bacilli bacterium]MDD3895434.1 SDR family NAD(P)-dependent oxidoreductase [Bacilli bacterium]MDD4407607.1 SDR family NAD(P)-dependent oxidoreductase [Bacilli bacterium]
MVLNSKRVIVTGGASGVGKELVKQLLEKGAYVSALDINIENLKKLKAELNNDKLFIYQVDVTNDKNIKDFKKDYFKDQPWIDVLINNAGIIQPFINISDLDINIIEKVMNVNYYGPLKLIKTFINELKERDEAYILNVSSMGGFFPFPGQSAYGASKAALSLLTEGLYSELLDTNIKVSLVLPGAMATDIAKNSDIEIKENNSKEIKMITASEAADKIIKVIEKNKFKLYLGNDSKFMNFMYKLNAKAAIKFITKLMKK